MIRTLPALALTLALASPGWAAEAVDPDDFRDYAEGWTLHFERDGERWGEEQFFEGGDTLWRYKDGTCSEGAWRPYGGEVCFLYRGTEGEVLCWQVLRDDDGLLVRLMTKGDSRGMELRITGRDREPVLCGDPAVDL